MKNKRVYKKVTLSVHDVVVTKRIFLKDSNLFSPISLILPGSLVFAIIQLISSNKVFCQKFLWCLVHHNILVQGALDTKLNFSKEIICWSILNVWIVEKIQLEYMMACLSTLGGAYSSLGENSHSHALVAGTLSVRQFLIATRMNDLIMMSRCRIFYAYSLMQQRKLKTAANIIRREYIYSKTALHDNTLVKTCCLAVWNRLKYLSAKKKEWKSVGRVSSLLLLLLHSKRCDDAIFKIMQGLVLRQCGYKSWIVAHIVAQSGALVVSKTKEHYLQGEFIKVISLENIGVYVRDITDKYNIQIFSVKIHCCNTNTNILLGFRLEQTRNDWVVEILSCYSKFFVHRNDIRLRNDIETVQMCYRYEEPGKRNTSNRHPRKRPVSMFAAMSSRKNLFL